MASGSLRVSDNGRFLITSDGKPFFYLADTAWELIHRCHRGEANHYLINRAAKGFTAIQAVILSEIRGLTDPAAEGGHLPLIDMDPTKPNEPYFQHLDWIVERANQLGLYMALLPTWGSWAMEEKNSFFPPHQIFTPENARTYGTFLGKRYRNAKNIIWILGGDRNPQGYEAIWDAMAAGLAEGDGASHLITYHPRGEYSSAYDLHDRKWLDFNVIQSGHGRKHHPNYDMITDGYRRTPAKPILDAEPNYENLAVGFSIKNGMRFTDYDCRTAAYWSVFAGACGHTYGCNEIWQMHTPERDHIIDPTMHWKQALDLPGTYQMRHVKNLMLSRPYLTRIPDPGIISYRGAGSDYRIATRDGTAGKKDATFLMCYYPTLFNNQCDTSAIPAKQLRAWWYDPRNGIAYDQGLFDNTGKFEQPWHTRPWEFSGGPDWVLVIDDASKAYPAPGSAAL